MTPELFVEVLGTLRQGGFTPAIPGVGTRLETETLVVGSGPSRSPNLTLKDGTVSRNHAEVFVRDGAWRVRDLDSDNGLVCFPDVSYAGPDSITGAKSERISEAPIRRSLTLAVGAVVIRLTVEEK